MTMTDLFEKIFGRPMKEALQKVEERQYRASFRNQTRHEKQRRLTFVREMSLEWQRLMDADQNFCMAWVRGAVEEVIQGDWDGLKIAIDALRFKGTDRVWAEREREVFAPFVNIAQNAYESRPKSGAAPFWEQGEPPSRN